MLSKVSILRPSGSLLIGLIVSWRTYGGLPTTTSKPAVPCLISSLCLILVWFGSKKPVKTSGNSISQWKNRRSGRWASSSTSATSFFSLVAVQRGQQRLPVSTGRGRCRS